MSIAAIASDNLWAVGYYAYDASLDETALIEHWNGTAWTIVPGVTGSSSPSALNGISAVSASDVWAVGSITVNQSSQALIEHWNGTAWAQVSAPNVGDGLSAVGASSSGAAWAVGSYFDAGLARNVPLAERWNGSAWNTVVTQGGTIGSGFSGLAVTSTGDTWAVGFDFISNGYSATRPLIERWNGSSFYVVADGLATGQYGALNSVAAISTKSAWAVGTTGSHNALGSTLTEQYIWPRLSLHC